MIVQRALLSVSDKSGLTAFATGLSGLGVALVSSSGTAKALRQAGLVVQDVSELTGFPEILDGRVKTLHPAIHGGLLARRDVPQQMRQLSHQGIRSIELVAVNLYPFEQTVDEGTPLDAALNLIDIGGETLVRSAAKNFQSVVVLVDPEDYSLVLRQLKSKGDVDLDTRRALACKAFAHVTRYNAAITRYFDPALLPQTLCLTEPKTLALRYGENPQQQAALYGGQLQQLHGKALSYTNLLDLESAWLTVCGQPSPAASIIKHATPCGVALGRSPLIAFKQALKGDPMSAFGGVIGLNRNVGVSLATQITQRFFEAVVAPGFTESGLEVLRTKPNLRLILAPNSASLIEARSTAFGWVAQTQDHSPAPKFDIVTHKTLTDQQKQDLAFAWQVARQVKSNAIVLVKDRATVGIGAGQMSRVDAVKIAIGKAGPRASGAALASDGFFPFPDSVELAAAAGVNAIVQPGGSIKDGQVIEAADDLGIAMALTHTRVFRH